MTIDCGSCPCNERAFVPRPSGGFELAVVLDSPNESEAKYGTWLHGKRGGASALLRQVLEHYVDLDDVYFCSAVNCRPNPKKKAMQKNAMHGCRGRLVGELREAGVDKVLCVGPMGYGALTSQKALPAITKVRGRWKQAYGMNVMATLPPGFAIGEYEYFRDLARDVDKFFNTDGPEPQPDLEMVVLESVQELDEALEVIARYPFVSCDLETTGFSARSDRPLACGLGVLEGRDGIVYVLPEDMLESKKVWRRLQKLLNGPMDVVFHNAKFDLQFFINLFAAFGLEYAPQNVHDTMMLHYALDERPMGKYKCHSLENIARVRYDAPDYGIKMSEWLPTFAGAPPELREEMRHNMHIYMSLDVYYTGRLFPDLWNECLEEDETLLDLYERLFMPGTLALAEVENHGILLDRPMFEDSSVHLQIKADEILERIRDHVGNDDFNPGSPMQVKKLVYDDLGMDLMAGIEAAEAQVVDSRGDSKEDTRKQQNAARSSRNTSLETQALITEMKSDALANISSRKEGIRSRGTYTDPARLKSSPTAAPVLRMIARGYPDHAQLLEDICEWRNYSKNVGTYVNGLLRRCDVDGRIHGTFNIHGTASGRLSSTDPNLQNMPPASHTGIAIRSGFMAPEGWSIIDCDYKQLEVRMAGEMSHDPAMKELFESGGDPHSETSKIIYGREDVSHYERMLGKILTFGLLYGRSPDSIATGPEAEDIVARGGKRWGPNDVREFFGNLLGRWAVYAEWRQRCREAPYKQGEITFSIGRKRRFDFIPKHDGGHAGRQGINTPCQGTASDFCLYAVIRLTQELKPYRAHVISTVHDSILLECHDDDLEVVLPIVERVMTQDTLWETEVPLAIDMKVSKRWNEDDDTEYGGTDKSDEAAKTKMRSTEAGVRQSMHKMIVAEHKDLE